jgi:hypothetical protein
MGDEQTPSNPFKRPSTKETPEGDFNLTYLPKADKENQFGSDGFGERPRQTDTETH